MVKLRIENQAVIFALLARQVMQRHGDEGESVIQEGMIRYGRERGVRMAANAEANGDPVELWTNQAYGEWKPDYDGQMEFGTDRTEPTLRTYISKCAWCEAWKKYDLLPYGREYCKQVDWAVYDGFQKGSGAVESGALGGKDAHGKEVRITTELNEPMSWGGDVCRFDWGVGLTEDEQKKVSDKKKELGTSAMRDMNFHTAHMWYSMCDTIRKNYGGEDAEDMIEAAKREYIEIFGQEEFDVLSDYELSDF